MHASDKPSELEPVRDSRFGAAVYEPVLWLGEKLGMSARRHRLLAGAEGRVLEIGAGTGLNLPHYSGRARELVLAEPASHMAEKIDLDRLAADVPVSVAIAPAERLPFADASFDTVVATMVLCTVADPDRAVAEIARVLKPEGRFLFCEHVLAATPLRRRAQIALAGPWATLADGCRCDRTTLETIRAQMRIEQVDDERWRGMAPLVAPLVVGRAVPA